MTSPFPETCGTTTSEQRTHAWYLSLGTLPHMLYRPWPMFEIVWYFCSKTIKGHQVLGGQVVSKFVIHIEA